MRDYLIKFLKEMEELIPPPGGVHHAITFAQYGSDESGWEDRLAIRINFGGTFRCIFIDVGDFDKSPGTLAAEVALMAVRRGDL